jgi:hypothetical protein
MAVGAHGLFLSELEGELVVLITRLPRLTKSPGIVF